MTDSFVTQCPHCRTSFRISRGQLGAAHGVVRCGACLHVFNAAQQLLVDQSRASKPAAPAPSAPAMPQPHPAPAASAAPARPTAPPAPAVEPRAAPVPAPAASLSAAPASEKKSVDTLWIHDDLDLDSLDLDEELAKLEEQEMQLSKDFLALDRAPQPGESLLHRPTEERDRHDESWAESLLKDDAKPRSAPTPVPAPRPPVEAPVSAPLVARASDTLAASEAPAPVAPRREPALGSPAASSVLPPREEPSFSALDADDEPAADEIDEIDDANYARLSATPAAPARSEPALRDDSLFELAEEPLQLDWQEARKPWGRWIGWGLLNLLAAGALTSQYVLYHFEELARQDEYRPWFEQLCPELGCSLPSKVDIEQIKSTNLVVRSHPDYMNALMVDAIIYNRAPFAQPFPLLELRFADINGQLLASSRFKPSQYLGGELAGQAEMPPQTPIHVSLEISDPGTKAVNYSLSFHSPE
ncbi:hypothetical protein A9179_04325 [Pseudomonas alcaligenes]|uniref:Zinc finger/thioredoxin putative domain-containing protein n=1 Tax=Aquipseudomonas alcaligenes TaxID=43263 RepID=A0ABR7RW01_AQUAC|nr:DUF3426 domain-containing protein [Pseudomonas alcaligenes]MBC9249500.1 hypothetical protein [Pseudomonas alcaligenes]